MLNGNSRVKMTFFLMIGLHLLYQFFITKLSDCSLEQSYFTQEQSQMQIAFCLLENCSPAQKWVSILICDIRTSSIIRYLRGFQLCTTFCFVCLGSFSFLYHSCNVKFWVRIRVLRRRTRSSNVFYPAVSV